MTNEQRKAIEDLRKVANGYARRADDLRKAANKIEDVLKIDCNDQMYKTIRNKIIADIIKDCADEHLVLILANESYNSIELGVIQGLLDSLK